VTMTGAESSPAEHAQALLARGLVQWNEGDLNAAQKAAEQVRTIALKHELGRELGEASALLGMVAMAAGHWTHVFRQEFTAAMQLRPQESPVVLDANLCLAEAWLVGADCHGTADLARDLLEVAVHKKFASGEAMLSMLIGEAEYLFGHLDESTEWLSRAEGLYREMNATTGLALALLHLADVASASGRKAEASEELRAARRLADRSPLISHLRVRVLERMIKSADGPERCREVLEDAESMVARPKEICRPCSIGMRTAATIACADTGEIARSRRWLEGAERLAGMWSGGPWQAAVWEARAALRRAEGDDDQALALLREASKLFTQCGRSLDASRCQAAVAVAC